MCKLSSRAQGPQNTLPGAALLALRSEALSICHPVLVKPMSLELGSLTSKPGSTPFQLCHGQQESYLTLQCLSVRICIVGSKNSACRKGWLEGWNKKNALLAGSLPGPHLILSGSRVHLALPFPRWECPYDCRAP